MGNICCENTSNAGNIGVSYPIKDLRFEAVPAFQPNLSTLVSDAVKDLNKEPLHIDRSKHKASQYEPPKKEIVKNFVYDGEWAYGQPDGAGKIYFSNGQYYEGEFRDGQANGPGRYVFSDGATFDGNVEDNKARGEGKYHSGTVDFDGYWEGSRPSTGTYNLSNGTKIQLKTPHHGTIFFSNKDVYTGNISTELHPNGEGRMQFANGNTYDGDWRDGLMHGDGTFRWKESKATYEGIVITYLGGYQKGKKHGVGTFTYPDGRKYQGEWYNGLQHGAGKLTKDGNVLFNGFFSSGEPMVTNKSANGRAKGFGVENKESQYNAFRAGDIVEPGVERSPESRVNPDIPVYKVGQGSNYQSQPPLSNNDPKQEAATTNPAQQKNTSLFELPPSNYPVSENFGNKIGSGLNSGAEAAYKAAESEVRPAVQQFGTNAANTVSGAGTSAVNAATGAGTNAYNYASAAASNAINGVGNNFTSADNEAWRSNPIYPPK